MRDEQEKKTMNERIRAFYKQSGGPNNPQIEQIIEKHLLHGKDHGVPGKRETFKDAMMEVFLDDYTTKDIVMWLLKTKYDLSDRWQELISGRSMDQLAAAEEAAGESDARLDQLEKRLLNLESNIQKIVIMLEEKESAPQKSSGPIKGVARSQGF